MTPTTTDQHAQRESARRERVDAIRDAATVRGELGLLWQCRRDLLGGYIVWMFDRQADVLREFTAETLDQAIDKAKGARRR